MMNKAFPIISILFLAFLALGFQSCTPASGLLYSIEREKVIAVTNSALDHKTSAGNIQKYQTNLWVVQSGTQLFVRDDSSGWQTVDTDGYSVSSFAASGSTLYVIFTGNTGGSVGENPTLRSASFSTVSGAGTISWTTISLTGNPSKVVPAQVGNAIAQTMSNSGYGLTLFYCTPTTAAKFSPLQTAYPIVGSIIVGGTNYLLDQGRLYTYNDQSDLTLVNTATTLPNIYASPSSCFTGITVDSSTNFLYLSNINGNITTNNGVWKTLSIANGIPLTGLQFVSSITNKAGGASLDNFIALATRDRGPLTMDVSTLSLKSPDPMKLGNYSSSFATNLNGVAFDSANNQLYFTTLNKGLFSAIYNPNGQVSSNGFTFTWE